MNTENSNIDVGIRILNARKDKKMSRVELGKYVGLHETTIKKYEDGNIKSLDIEKLKEFAKYLGVTASYLIGWEDNNGNHTKEYIDEYVEKESFVDSLISLLVKQGKVEKYSDLTESQRKMIELAINQQIEEKNKGSV